MLPPACTSASRASTAASSATAFRSGGSWTVCNHVQTYGLNFDFGLGNALARLLEPRTSLEFGCGLGLYTSFLARTAKALCIEPQPMPTSIFGHSNPQQLRTDLANATAPMQACDRALPTFELTFSLEVLEHIPAAQHGQIFDFLVRHAAGFVVFSAGHPGQHGSGHVANRPRSEWMAELTSRGLEFLPRTTALLVSMTREKMKRSNLLAFATAGAPLGRGLDEIDQSAAVARRWKQQMDLIVLR